MIVCVYVCDIVCVCVNVYVNVHEYEYGYGKCWCIWFIHAHNTEIQIPFSKLEISFWFLNSIFWFGNFILIYQVAQFILKFLVNLYIDF